MGHKQTGWQPWWPHINKGKSTEREHSPPEYAVQHDDTVLKVYLLGIARVRQLDVDLHVVQGTAACAEGQDGHFRFRQHSLAKQLELTSSLDLHHLVQHLLAQNLLPVQVPERL